MCVIIQMWSTQAHIVHLGLSAHRKKAWGCDTEATCFGEDFRSDSPSRWILGLGGAGLIKGAEEQGSKGSLWFRSPEACKSQRHNPEAAAKQQWSCYYAPGEMR